MGILNFYQHRWSATGIRILLSLLVVAGLFANLGIVQAEVSGATLYVASTGVDTGTCRTASAPCKTVQYAANKTVTGDVIRVAAGTYRYNSAADTCSFLVTRAVFCVVDKNISVFGGFSTSDWTNSNPTANPTIIDGANTYRGVAVIAYNKNVNYIMDGFTIQNGLSSGTSSSDGLAYSGRGGGLWAQNSVVVLSNMVFKNNRALGGNGHAGATFGGALMIEASRGGTPSLQNIVFDGNSALGGSGSPRGGVAEGGALCVSATPLTGSNLTFTNNIAQGGAATSGSGQDSGGMTADSLGGAVAFGLGSSNTLVNVVALNNKSIGGSASAAGSKGGSGLGGFAHVEGGTLVLTKSKIQGNQAIGGAAYYGGNGMGGGIMTDKTNITIEEATIVDNLAQSGTGTNSTQTVNAGGLYFAFYGSSGAYTANIHNTVISNNHLVPGNASMIGGGGGLVVQGMVANVSQTTIAGNTMVNGILSGQAILVLASAGESGVPGVLNLTNSIVSDHTNGGAAAVISVMRNSSIVMNTILAANNARLTNEDNMPVNAGSFTKTNILTAPAANYKAPGSPSFDYHLRFDSPAINQAAASAVADDLDGDARPQDGVADLGADEYVSLPIRTWPVAVIFLTDAAKAGSVMVQVADSDGNPIQWTASSSSTWLSLGSQQNSRTYEGTFGEGLQINFLTASLPNGTYNTTINLTSATAKPVSLSVQLVKVSASTNVFLPAIRR